MPSTNENMAMIRRLLGSPNPQQPDQALLFELFGNQVLNHQSQLANSGAPWSVNQWSFSTAQGTEDYIVTAADFGKPFLCYTVDPSNPYLPRVEIPFCQLQNTDQFYSGPRQVYSNDSNIFTAVVMSFYYVSGSPYVRVTPVPGGSAQYTVWYETAPTAPQSLGDSPGLTPFHHLIRVETALAALPYCGWGDLSARARRKADADAWKTQAEAIRQGLGMQQQQFERQFETFLANLMEAGVERRQGFGDDYLGATDWSTGVGVFGYGQNVGP